MVDRVDRARLRSLRGSYSCHLLSWPAICIPLTGSNKAREVFQNLEAEAHYCRVLGALESRGRGNRLVLIAAFAVHLVLGALGKHRTGMGFCLLWKGKGVLVFSR